MVPFAWRVRTCRSSIRRGAPTASPDVPSSPSAVAGSPATSRSATAATTTTVFRTIRRPAICRRRSLPLEHHRARRLRDAAPRLDGHRPGLNVLDGGHLLHPQAAGAALVHGESARGDRLAPGDEPELIGLVFLQARQVEGV